jgi:hypothetical protein
MTSDLTTGDLPAAVRLKPQLDADRLRRELERLESRSWRPEEPYQFESFFGTETKIYHDGKWVGLSLRSQGGRLEKTDPGGPGLDDFADTELLDHAPYMREVLQSLRSPLRSARLLRLPPGGVIAEHRDTYHGFEYGQLRLHAPITTNERVTNVIRGRHWYWKPGELWYGDFGSPHHVRNDGASDRVHLVVDVMITPETLGLFPPNVADDLARADVLFHEPPAQLPLDKLSRLQCTFWLPSTLVRGIFDVDDGIVAQLRAHMVLQQGSLVLNVESRDVFKLLPLANNRLTLAGWTLERYFEYAFDGGRLSTLALVLRRGREETRINFHVAPCVNVESKVS